MAFEGMIAETVAILGDKHEPISAYAARPLGSGPFPGIVLMHHAPGWDEWYFETTRKFAHHGWTAGRRYSPSCTSTWPLNHRRCAPRSWRLSAPTAPAREVTGGST
jgi:hypothetical protein